MYLIFCTTARILQRLPLHYNLSGVARLKLSEIRLIEKYKCCSQLHFKRFRCFLEMHESQVMRNACSLHEIPTTNYY